MDFSLRFAHSFTLLSVLGLRIGGGEDHNNNIVAFLAVSRIRLSVHSTDTHLGGESLSSSVNGKRH